MWNLLLEEVIGFVTTSLVYRKVPINTEKLKTMVSGYYC